MADPAARRVGLGAEAGAPHVPESFRGRRSRSQLAQTAVRFEDFIERTYATLNAAGVKSKRDPRVFVCLSMVMLEFGDTLVPGRRRERIPMQALARLGRLLRLAGEVR